MSTKKVGSKTFDELLEEWDAAVKVEPEPPQGFLPMDVIAKRVSVSKGITYASARKILREMLRDEEIEHVNGPRKFQGETCSHIWYKPK